jgi:hypothetical protein
MLLREHAYCAFALAPGLSDGTDLTFDFAIASQDRLLIPVKSAAFSRFKEMQEPAIFGELGSKALSNELPAFDHECFACAFGRA